jgi:CheY-like chemotaxis protein
MQDPKRILWADDEIDLLRPHILFLKERGYDVTPVTNGDDAISLVRQERFDAVLLDEMMPGRGGLDTLGVIQELSPGIAVIMITKNEEELLMNEAIGQQIADYLTKPVNPSQIWLALKRILEGEGIRKSTLTRDYIRELNDLAAELASDPGADAWLDIGERIARWDLRIERIADAGIRQSLADQKREANSQFSRFIEGRYADWVRSDERPMLSVDLLERVVFPMLRDGHRVAFVLIDCMRLDHWYAIQPILEPFFDVSQHLYYSILPTATPYARNAIFSGLFPKEIAERHPEYWDEDPAAEGSRNRFESELLGAHLARSGLALGAWKYQRAFSREESATVRRQAASFASMDFVALVFNFLDILAHGRSESDILHELAPDEVAFRRLLVTWFQHSKLFEILRTMSSSGTRVVITTDHGAVLVNRSALVHGNRETSTNLRYKFGSNLKVDPKQAVHVKDPAAFMLPDDGLTKHYVFAKESHYFVYPTNFHRYERQFKDTFQHGGVSIEEMILPCAVLTPRG